TPTSVQLSFLSATSARIVVINLNITASSFVFTWTKDAPPTDSRVVSTLPASPTLPDDTYTVVLSYQDSLGNPPNSASLPNIVVQSRAKAPTLTAPAAATAVLNSTIFVNYTVPAAPKVGVNGTFL